MESQPIRPPAPIHAPKAKPDPRPMRVALGFGGVAALSALAAAIVLPPRPVTSAPAAVGQPTAVPSDNSSTTETATPAATRPILYVQLAPGQTAPPGAIVIDAATPTAGAAGATGAAGVRPPAPVTQVAPPKVVAPPVPVVKPAPTPIIIKTTQSGTVLP